MAYPAPGVPYPGRVTDAGIKKTEDLRNKAKRLLALSSPKNKLYRTACLNFYCFSSPLNWTVACPFPR
jgi:hypothetical protein